LRFPFTAIGERTPALAPNYFTAFETLRASRDTRQTAAQARRTSAGSNKGFAATGFSPDRYE